MKLFNLVFNSEEKENFHVLTLFPFFVVCSFVKKNIQKKKEKYSNLNQFLKNFKITHTWI